MNCVIHNDTAAVNTCNVCNGGICADCVAKKLTLYDRLICEACYIDSCQKWLHDAKSDIATLEKVKRNFTIILFIGLCIGAATFVNIFMKWGFLPALWYGTLYASLVWGCHIFFDKGIWKKVKREKSTEQQIRDGVMDAQMMKDGSIFMYWGVMIAFGICMFIFRGFFFPFFYWSFLRKDDKGVIEKYMAEVQANMESVIQYGDLHNKQG